MINEFENRLYTYFDTPFRSTPEDLEQSKNILFKQLLVSQLLEGFPNLAVMLDTNRQIVAYNKNAERILIPNNEGSIYGQRVGEALRCIHAFDMEAGCGTSQFCSECGAGKCNKTTRETLQSCQEECRITINRDNTESSLDLKVFTSNITIDNNDFTLFSIEDIQNEKRRKVLEKIFFHDVLNTASAIHGMSEIIREADNPDDINEFKNLLYNSSGQLIREIETQRDLINAEQGNLTINLQTKSVNEIISIAYDLYRDHELSRGVNYVRDFLKEDFSIRTDTVLLNRSLSNLIKNALEAVNKKGHVSLYAIKEEDRIVFNVTNSTIMPDNIKLQIFQRSFSTKAVSGRGIGTYSVKLLVEQYLGGNVSFISDEESGTIFSISLPIMQ